MEQVNHPAHYEQYRIEVIEIVRKMSFDQGNLIKYLLRAPFKGSYATDLAKAAWYFGDMIQNKVKFRLKPGTSGRLMQVVSDLKEMSKVDPRCRDVMCIVGDIASGDLCRAHRELNKLAVREWEKEQKNG